MAGDAKIRLITDALTRRSALVAGAAFGVSAARALAETAAAPFAHTGRLMQGGC